MLKIFNCLMIFSILSCGGLPTSPNLVGGTVLGAGATLGVEKVAKALTPVYPLYMPVSEFCELKTGDSETVICYLVPCNEDCSYELSYKDFLDQNPRCQTIRASSLNINAIQTYCSKNTEQCEHTLWKYVAGKIILVEP